MTDDDTAAELFDEIVGFCIAYESSFLSDLTFEYEAMAEDHNVDYTLKYFVEPFGLELSAKGDYAENREATKGSIDVYEYVTFDNYGYLNKIDVKAIVTSIMTIAGTDYESKISTEIHATVSYK